MSRSRFRLQFGGVRVAEQVEPLGFAVRKQLGYSAFATVENPWADLPEDPPYVLPGDRAALEGARGVRLDVLPVPFIGSPARAALVLLALNPGFDASDVAAEAANRYMAEQQRLSLTFRSTVPFWVLDRKLSDVRGFTWWTKRLSHLASIVGWDFVRERVMCVQLFPYRSRTFSAWNVNVQSRAFSVELVQDAMRRRRAIVITRSRRLWLQAAPELSVYPYEELMNPRALFLTPTNMRPGAFVRLTTALHAAR